MISPTDSPADVFAQLITDGIPAITRPVTGQGTKAWQITVGALPTDTVDRISLADMNPVIFARNHRTGKIEGSPGVVVYVRANKYQDGWTKCQEILDYMTTVKRAAVVRNGRAYTVHAVKLTSGPFFIGTSEERLASNFTLNYTFTLTQES